MTARGFSIHIGKVMKHKSNKEQTPADRSSPMATIIIILGATGDLTWRKLMPGLYNLYLDKWLPEKFAVLGVSRKTMSDNLFAKHLKEGIDKFSRRGKAKNNEWDGFAKYLHYFEGEFDNDATYSKIGKQIHAYEKKWGSKVNRVFYMAVPPIFFEDIARRIGNSGLAKNKDLCRIVVEKPFGRDFDSAKKLNDLLHSMFKETQIYRIDHYLGKETVQNIMAFRFANALFEPIWNRNYIDHIQITVAEQLGIENRGNYYETAGALRDMIQNHLLQLLCLVTMEPPVSFQADEVRNKKVDVLNAIRQIKSEDVHKSAVRGQYGAGWIEGKKVKAYRQEEDVQKDSNTETFAAIKLFLDNWRWQGVPFYLRTGKRMTETTSIIIIQFKPVPHQSFPAEASANWEPNRFELSIQPHMGIRIRFQAKKTGLEMLLHRADMVFNYNKSYASGIPEAYETLLLDIMLGDSTLFMRTDQVEAAWKILMPVINAWEKSPANFPNYSAGFQGPEEAEALIARDGHNWIVNEESGK